MNSALKLIGLTGTNGAGKGESARFFVDSGFAFFSLSDIIRRELEVRGLEENRDNLIRTGNELRETSGADVLARRVMALISDHSVIDSIRNPEEIAALREFPGFLLLALDAPVGVRYERTRKRGRNESSRTLEEFQAKEAEEWSDRKTRQQLHACIRLADHVIQNDGTLDELRAQLEKFL